MARMAVGRGSFGMTHMTDFVQPQPQAAAAPFAPWTLAASDVVEAAAALATTARVLDLGAGLGRHSMVYARAGHEVVAIDTAPDAVAALRNLASREGLEIDAREGLLSRLPDAAGSFDHVLCWDAFCTDDEAATRRILAELGRVLRPGGTLLGRMPSRRNLAATLAHDHGREISRNTWVFDGAGIGGRPHHFCSAVELAQMLDGFEPRYMEDRETDGPGSHHWHFCAERV